MLATFAQFERRLIGERTREAMAVRKAQGVQLGRPRALPAKVRARIRRRRSRREVAGRDRRRTQPRRRADGPWRATLVSLDSPGRAGCQIAQLPTGSAPQAQGSA